MIPRKRWLTSILVIGILTSTLYFTASFYYAVDYSDFISSIAVNGWSLRRTQLDILCLVLTRASSTDLQDAIMDTWAVGCTDLLFLLGNASISDNYELIERRSGVYTLIVKVEDAYDNNWLKVRAAMRFVNETWPKSFDWFMRIDDDAFVIFENLNDFLSTKDIQSPVMFGAHYSRYIGGYIGTGPGILISQSAFINLMQIFDVEKRCRTNLRTHNDDVELGVCLKAAKVPFGNSSDEFGRPRFIPISLHDLLNNPSAPNHGFFEQESAYPVGEGIDECCSDELIALHYVNAGEIRRFHQIAQKHPLARRNLRLFINETATARKIPAQDSSWISQLFHRVTSRETS